MAEYIGIIITQLVSVVIGSLIAAVLLRAAAQWIEKTDIPYGEAYVTMLISGLVNSFFGFSFGFIVGQFTASESVLKVLESSMLLVGFLILSGVISSRMRISFWRACILSFVMVAIAFAVALVLIIVVVAVRQ